ncbi:TetR family transcriptional regulator [Prauserella shujinwangii]|uniref:TetR family transcriptional regulator n=1 Tax=Prauserella shujinwangii TaxID=1453103 RepID=A0A2T0LQ20_9PSEU|nr:TetR/AcrR family transcriptional regulator [Prauserella shujinwangii]PRX45400.1 TetR family transcriptional regulator [Prauserella shujinwangii]
MSTAEAPQRRWRGEEPDDRRARRRRRLVEAGLELMGTEGAAAVSMRGVCRQARLTERYFYESFPNREALLVAVLEAVALAARDVVLAALADAPERPPALVRHVVRAFTEHVTEDPRRGRIMFVESLAAPELTRRGSELVKEFTQPIARTLRDGLLGGDDPDTTDIELNALAVFGSLAYLYQAWLERGLDLPVDRFVEHIAQVVERIALASSG